MTSARRSRATPRQARGAAGPRGESRHGESPADALARFTGRRTKKVRSDRKPVAQAWHAPAPVDERNLVAVAVPVVTANESNGSHQHWRVVQERRKGVRAVTTRALNESGCAPPSPPLVAILTRHSAGELDDDGLRSALKSVRDAVAKWLGIDDKKRELVAYGYAQEKCKRGLGWVTVEVRRRET